NAQLMLEEKEGDDSADSGRALAELAEALDLPGLPSRIECYDISNISGTSAVGSMVVFEEGYPAPYAYRRFRIKGVEGIDDYAMMSEVLTRRSRRLMRAEEGAVKVSDTSFATLPDLILIDGGPGHVSAAVAALSDTPLQDIPLAGIAKREEILYLPGGGEPLRLRRNSEGLKLVQRLRDEAHRFAIDYHRQLRSKGGIRSILDDVPGIGPKRRNALLAHFNSIEAMAAASEEELADVPGMTKRAARSVKRYLVERSER
ncbi:MAG: helix-hairpin-helix domain-containing protein, partial [Bacillota bacterium]